MTLKTKIKKGLDWISKVTDEYSDTSALVFISVGGLLAAIAMGSLNGGGTTGGYSFIYLKHPTLLRIGLMAIVFGFVMQLSDNLTQVHKLSEKKTSWPLVIIFIMLITMALWS